MPGMEIAKPIYNEKGGVLIGKGVALTQNMIESLKKRNVVLLYIKDKALEDLEFRNDIPLELRVEATNTIKETFKELSTGTGKRGKSLEAIKIDKIQSVFKSLLSEIQNTKNAMNLLTNVLVHDDYTFAHSTNVTIYTLAMAVKLGFNEKQLNEIGLGGMLHDIGKCFIPIEILNKRGKLSDEEFEMVKQHTEFGFQILRKEHSVPLLSAHCAFQHHEKIDGSGYPRGLKGKEIHPYAKIMAVADVFDALTSHRSYRKAMLPHEAMEILFAGTHTHFEHQYITVFQKSVATYPEGVTVELNTGETAVVIDYKFEAPARPLVRVIKDPYGNDLKTPYEIDLSKELNIMITKCDAIMG